MRLGLAVAVVLVLVGSARADGPASSVTKTSLDPAPSGIAIGAEIGDPSSVTCALFAGKLDIAAAIGTGTLEGFGISTHVDAQLAVAELAPHVPLRVGLGGRFYHHGYKAMSVDEIPDSHLGVRASASVALERNPLQLYAEVAPGVDLVRSRSCTFADGAASICPHAQDRPVFVQFVVGVRWFLSR